MIRLSYQAPRAIPSDSPSLNPRVRDARIGHTCGRAVRRSNVRSKDSPGQRTQSMARKYPRVPSTVRAIERAESGRWQAVVLVAGGGWGWTSVQPACSGPSTVRPEGPFVLLTARDQRQPLESWMLTRPRARAPDAPTNSKGVPVSRPRSSSAATVSTARDGTARRSPKPSRDLRMRQRRTRRYARAQSSAALHTKPLLCVRIPPLAQLTVQADHQR